MNIDEFNVKYASLKDIDPVFVDVLCTHPQHKNENKSIKKVAAKRNILKREGKEFICRACDMHYNNPVSKAGQGRRQSDELIIVYCPHPEHAGKNGREMKKSCFYGKLEEPYQQICGSCAQKGKIITEEQKQAITKALKGTKRDETFKKKISNYMKNNKEGIERGKKNLIPGYSAGWNKGQPLDQETKDKISAANTGKKRTIEHKYNVSIGRKKMLEEQGGFTDEHRENISKATIKQYANGFDPALHHKSGYHFSSKVPNGQIFYRSSYEKKAYEILDKDETVVSYKAESLPIEYYNPVKKIFCNYLVDIEIDYVNGNKKFIEVKPEKWLKDDVVQAKNAAARHQLKDKFEIWTEIKLFPEGEKQIRDFAITL
jgi:hypothetical protein